MRPPLRDALVASAGVTATSLLAFVLIVVTDSANLGFGVAMAGAVAAGVWWALRQHHRY